jgi:very-short-patch-repair endonuclease
MGSRPIDITKEKMGKKIAIEYDSWFEHSHLAEKDYRKDRALLADGWLVLRVLSNRKLPSIEQIDDAIGRLVAGEPGVDIVLEDWGKGSTRRSLALGEEDRE